MANVREFIENKVSPIATKIADSKFITCLMSGYSSILGLILIGSIASLITGFQYFGVSEWLARVGIAPYLSLINTFTSGCISLFLVMSVSHAVGRRDYDETESRVLSFICLTAFLIMTPLVSNEGGARGVATMYLGAKGMFVAIILAFLIPWFYAQVVKRGWVVKMPESVPPFIEKSFKALIPASVILLLATLASWGFSMTPHGSIHECIYSVLAAPFESISGNIFGYIMITFLIQLFWFFGIHGGMTFDAIKNTLFTQAAIENIAAYGAGDPMQHIVTIGLSDLAGSSAAQGLGLLICMIFFCRRQDFKAIARVGLVPQIFSITEPVRFGVPTVFNFTLMIPLLVFQPLIEFIAWACCNVGILSYPRVAGVKNVPFLLSGFMEGGVSGVVFQLFALALSVALFFPFVKMYEKQENAEDERRNEKVAKA